MPDGNHIVSGRTISADAPSREMTALYGSDPDTERRARWMAWACVLLVTGMVGLSYAAVPLYEIFCQVTGYGGTTSRAQALPAHILERSVTVRFDANTASALPWDFKPVSAPARVQVGESALAFYQARNTGQEPVVGTATFNITPQKAGTYFTKIDCFCFTEQRLEPGQVMDMPVTFFIDPEIAEDPDMDDVSTITLSYTFFPKTDTL